MTKISSLLKEAVLLTLTFQLPLVTKKEFLFIMSNKQVMRI